MARPALTDEQRRETRRVIRDAAARLHAQSGMRDISARAIAQAAGVSVGTIYVHFGNSTELMQSLWKQPVKRLINELNEAVEHTADPYLRLRLILETYLKFAADQRSVYRGAFMHVRPEEHEKPRQVALADDGFFNLFRNTVAQCQATGRIRPGNPDTITQLLWSGIHGAIALPINIDRLALDASDQIGREMIALLLGALEPKN